MRAQSYTSGVPPSLEAPTTAATFRPVRAKRARDLEEDEDDELAVIAALRRQRAPNLPADMYIISSESDEQDRIGGASALLQMQAERALPPGNTPASVARLGIPGVGATPALSADDGQLADDENGSSGVDATDGDEEDEAEAASASSED